MDESDDEITVGKVADVLDTMGKGGEEGEDDVGGEGDSIKEVVEEVEGDDRSMPRTRGEGEGFATNDASSVVICHHQR